MENTEVYTRYGMQLELLWFPNVKRDNKILW